MTSPKCFLAVLFVALPAVSSLFAQLSTVHPPEALLPIKLERGYFTHRNESTPPADLKSLMLESGDFKVARHQMSNTSLMYRPHLAFFCRVEVKIDEAVGTPFRFRLGSVDYVDYLEGKRRGY